MITRVTSHSPEQTFQLGESLGKQLTGNEIILLYGGLGAGKTLFTKGLASANGIDPEDVVSPTFTLLNQYDTFFHFDLYRLGPYVAHLPEIDDYYGDGVMVIEWAQYLNPEYAAMNNIIQVYFHLDDGDDNGRIMEFKSELPFQPTVFRSSEEEGAPPSLG